MLSRARIFLAVLASLTLSGCGLTTPKMQVLSNDPRGEEVDENTIINQIKCELHKGVQDTLTDFENNPSNYAGKNVEWLRKWGALVTFELTVDEKGGVSPGITFVTPFVTPSQSFSLALGAQVSTEATRKETISFSYNFADLLAEGPIAKCDDENGVMIHSDLRIGEFISNKAFVAAVPGTIIDGQNGFPFSAFNYAATFVLMYGGELTPTWKLVRLSASTNSNLLSATRTKTQYVTITLGPVTNPKDKTTPAVLGDQALELHQATLIGQAVATSIQSLNPP